MLYVSIPYLFLSSGLCGKHYVSFWASNDSNIVLPRSESVLEFIIKITSYELPSFFKKLFLLSYIFFSAPLPFFSLLFYPLPRSPCSQFTQEICLFYFPCRLDPCMSLLGSSLLSRFSGIVNFGLVFLYV